MNKFSKQLISVVLVVAGIGSLISAYVLKESLLWGLALLLPSSATLFWYDELTFNRKVWTSAALVVMGITMIMLGLKDFDCVFSLWLIGGSILVFAGSIFAWIGFCFYLFNIKTFSEKIKERNK